MDALTQSNPKPTAEIGETQAGGWTIALSQDATVHDISTLSYRFDVRIVDDRDADGLILAPRSSSAPRPTQQQLDRALDDARATRRPEPRIAVG